MAYESDNTFKRAYANQIGQGKGEAYIHDDFSKEARGIGMKIADNDYAKAEEAEKKRILYGQDSDIELDGWDVDVNGQLAGQLSELKGYYADQRAKGINPLDPQNAAEYKEYNKIKGQLNSNMKTSTGQKDTYTKAMTALVKDKLSADPQLDYEKSMKMLNDFRAGKISERELLGSELLVSAIETDQQFMDKFTDGLSELIDDSEVWDPNAGTFGEYVNTGSTEVDHDRAKGQLAEMWDMAQADPAKAKWFKDTFKTKAGLQRFYDANSKGATRDETSRRAGPKPLKTESENFGGFEDNQLWSAENDNKLINDMIAGDQNAIADLKNMKYKGNKISDIQIQEPVPGAPAVEGSWFFNAGAEDAVAPKGHIIEITTEDKDGMPVGIPTEIDISTEEGYTELYNIMNENRLEGSKAKMDYQHHKAIIENKNLSRNKRDGVPVKEEAAAPDEKANTTKLNDIEVEVKQNANGESMYIIPEGVDIADVQDGLKKGDIVFYNGKEIRKK